MSEKLIARLMFLGTLLLFIAGSAFVARDVLAKSPMSDAAGISRLVIFFLAVVCLFYGNAVYQITRIGQLDRHAAFVEPPRESLEAFYFSETPPSVAILIPCYKEELSVLMQTMLSAAFAEYPDRRMTILIDDPPHGGGADYRALCLTRELVAAIDLYFRSATEILQQEAADFEASLISGLFSPRDEKARLDALYHHAAAFVDELDWYYKSISNVSFAHSDSVFRRDVMQRLTASHRSRLANMRAPLTLRAARQEYRRLAKLFDVPISSFERKTFVNLSHAPNKAMNLNSYISTMGRSFALQRSDGLLKLVASESDATLHIPSAKYILTIDADSVVLPDYLLKLVSAMEADPKIAVAQTPYSAYRNPPTAIERIAGATTDIQYLVHQGLAAYGATFWVGANALLRYSALQDIARSQKERGYEVKVYIQDTTLIEDTGSSIDLLSRGWRLHNYPQRLAYSATPPDFGALVIQRTRWANGGLIIFPALLSLLFRRSGKRIGAREFFLRSHYLLSPALTNASLLILLIVPFATEFANPCLILAACPYYLFYGMDLRRAGYSWHDLLRHYALTLLLVPVNLSGVYRSCKQLATGRKTPFRRTPKVSGRTATPVFHLLFPNLLAVAATGCAIFNLEAGNLLFFFFCSINAAFLIYAQARLVGFKAAAEDLWLATAEWRLRRTPKAEKTLRLGIRPDGLMSR